MKKNIGFLIDNDDFFYRLLGESLKDELEELYPEIICSFIASIGDILKADFIIISGAKIRKKYLWVISLFRKKFISCDKMLLCPNPILLSDIATPKQVDKIWRREKMVSKRGCIGLINLGLNSAEALKLSSAINLLIEDLDLNFIFLSGEREDKELSSMIKYSANVKYLDYSVYSPKEILGIMEKTDLMITSDLKGALLCIAAGRPFVGIKNREDLAECINMAGDQEAVLDIDGLSENDLYSRIKISWVHRDSTEKEVRKKAQDLKKKAEEEVREFGKKIISSFAK